MNVWLTTIGVLFEAHTLELNETTFLEFETAEVLRKAASRITCYSRYADRYKDRRYSTTQIVGVSQGSTIHHILKVQRTR